MKTALATLLAISVLCGTACAGQKKSFWELLRDKSPRSDDVSVTPRDNAS